MLKGCVQNLKREFADLAVGMAAFTGQISQLVLRYRQWYLIDDLSPNSLVAAEKCITGSRAENLVGHFCQRPITIVRPSSIVPFTSTLRYVNMLPPGKLTGALYRTHGPLPVLYSVPATPILSRAVIVTR
jgi:hypothetical protein